MAEETYRQQEVDRRITWLEEHYSIFNEEMGGVKASTDWLTWATRWIIAGIFGNLALAILGIILNIK